MPYKSVAQQRWAHTKEGTRALGGKGKVAEWDSASKGKSLPRRIPSFGYGTEVQDYAKAVARRYGLNEKVFLRLIDAESSWNPEAVSPVGAIGLGQLMPDTAKELGVDPTDWQQNLDGSARYLKQQLEEFGSYTLALAAYNAGPGSVREYKGVPPFKDTQDYVHKILGSTGQVYKEPSGVRNLATPPEPGKEPKQPVIPGIGSAIAKKFNIFTGNTSVGEEPAKPTSSYKPGAGYTPVGKYQEDAQGYWNAAEEAWNRLEEYRTSSGKVLRINDKTGAVEVYKGVATDERGNPTLDRDGLPIEQWGTDEEGSQILREALHYQQRLENLEAGRKSGLFRSGEDSAKAWLSVEKDKAAEATRKMEDYTSRIKDVVALEDMPTSRANALAVALSNANKVNSERTSVGQPLATVNQPMQTPTQPFADAIRKTIPSEAPMPYNIDPAVFKANLFPPVDPGIKIKIPGKPLPNYGMPSPDPMLSGMGPDQAY